MTDEAAAASESQIEGRMFLFEQPELLSKEQHDNIGLTPSETPFEFARNVRSVPISISEITSAQKHFPVVFTNTENPMLIGVLGVLDDVNLFIDDDGQWEINSYVPSYVRCHPFAFARDNSDNMAVIIDRASSIISESPATPFFDGDELSPDVRARVEMSGRFEAERKHTEAFCEKLKQFDLFAPQQASFKLPGNDEEQVVAEYVTINTQKFSELDKDALYELHKSDYLYPIFGTVASLENWKWLMTLRVNRQTD